MKSIRIIGSNEAQDVVGGGLLLTGLDLADGAIQVAKHYRPKQVQQVEQEVQSGYMRVKTSIRNRGWIQTGVAIGNWLVNAIGS